MKKFLAGVVCAAVLTVPALAQGQWSVQVDGAALDLGGLAPYEESDRVMIPLRRVAEALGFTVTWDGAARAAQLDDGTVKTTVTIGSDSYFMASSTAEGMSAPQSFGAAPALVEGSTFVPTELFTLLCGKTTVEEGVVNISSQTGAQMPNPMQRYDDLDGAAQALGFSVMAPDSLPQGYALADIYVTGGTMLDLRYHSQEGSMTFRMAQGAEDISGDYTQYANVVRQPEGAVQYTLKGDGTAVSLVTWTAGEYSFALSFQPATDPDTAVATAVATAQQVKGV